jgi:hypothetical protein
VDLFLLFLVRKWVCLFYFLHFVAIFVFLIHFPFSCNAPESRHFALCMLLNAVHFFGLTVKHVFEWPSTFSLVNIQVRRNRSSTTLWNMTLSSFSQCTDFWNTSSILSTGTELIFVDKVAEFESCHSNSSTAEC